MTWTRCSDRWPPCETNNLVIMRPVKTRLHGPLIAHTSANAASWLTDRAAYRIHPDDLYLILPAVPCTKTT